MNVSGYLGFGAFSLRPRAVFTCCLKIMLGTICKFEIGPYIPGCYS